MTIKWYEIEPKDRVSFNCPRLQCNRTRTVLSVHEGGVRVWHGGKEIVIPDHEITGLVERVV